MTCLKLVIVSGQAINYQKFRAALDKLNPELEIQQVYTATECMACPLALAKDEEYKNGSNPTGKIVRLPGVEFKLDNFVYDEHLGREVGEVCVRGPFVFKE